MNKLHFWEILVKIDTMLIIRKSVQNTRNKILISVISKLSA